MYAQQQPVQGQQPPQATQPQTTTEYGEFGGNSDFGGKRMDYSEPVYNDLWAMILFYLHVIVLIVLIIILFSKLDLSGSSDTDTYTDTGTDDSVSDAVDMVLTSFGVSVLIAAIVGIVFGLIWLQLMKMFAEYIIKGMLFFNLFCWVIIIVLGFALDIISIAIIGIIGFAFIALYTWCVWGRIPFASVLLSIASTIASTYEGTIIVSLMTCVFDLLWFIIWLLSFIAYFLFCESEDVDPVGFVIFLYLVSLYWGFFVFKNVSHTTTCGVAATWYFSANPQKPSQAALKRTMTTSFGSVCFGSLLVAILRALRSFLRSTKRGVLICIAMCLLYCIEMLLRYFNTYAFAQVAIYGSSYIEAAKATWNLLRSKGVDAIINDDLTGLALSCGAFFGFVVSFIAAFFVAQALLDPYLEVFAWIFAFYGALVGYGLCVLILLVVRSAVVALFVCFAEDPAAMSQTRPTEYKELINAHTGMQNVASGILYDPDGKRAAEQTTN